MIIAQSALAELKFSGMTSGGPNHKTDTIMYYIYYTAFKQYKYGYGNAMGVVLAVIIAILSAVQFKLGNKDN